MKQLLNLTKIGLFIYIAWFSCYLYYYKEKKIEKKSNCYYYFEVSQIRDNKIGLYILFYNQSLGGQRDF
jgi:hypothetical protein